jgi:hypothetical protein
MQEGDMDRKGARLLAVALGFALALALGAGACGGDDGPTRAEFVREADAVCAKAQQQLRITSAAQDDPVAFIERVIERRREVISKLDALEAPDDIADDVDSYVDHMRRWTAITEKILSEIEPEADGVLRDLGVDTALTRRRDRLADRATALAKSFGLKACTA